MGYHPWTAEHDDQLRRYCQKGRAAPQIAAAMGFAEQTIRRKRKALGLPVPASEHPPVDMQLVRRLLDERKQYPEICEAIEAAGGPRLTRRALGYHIRAAGWYATGGTRPRGSNWSLLGAAGHRGRA